MASSPSAFLASTLSTTFKHKKRKITPFLVSSGPTKEKDDDPSGCGEGMKLAKLAIVTLAAGVITFGSVHEASAAKSGGRVGGQAFRSSAPRSSSPRINNSRDESTPDTTNNNAKALEKMKMAKAVASCPSRKTAG
ncbi:hypothetical protein ACLOJK_036813 [Asimina triloba]